MEALLDELHQCQAILKGQLKDLDKRRKGEEERDPEAKAKKEKGSLEDLLSDLA